MSLSSFYVFLSSALVAASVLACGAAEDDDFRSPEGDGESEAALSASAKRLAGTYVSETSSRAPTFKWLRLESDDTFTAFVDNGVPCDPNPEVACDSIYALRGTYTATATTLRLAGDEGWPYYGSYELSTAPTGGIEMRRSGAAWSGWSNTLSRSPGIVTSDTTQIFAESSGNMMDVDSVPAGTNCTIGHERYTFTLATGKLEWMTCDYRGEGQPSLKKSGTTTLSSAQVDTVLAVVRAAAITTSKDGCGNDKPELKVAITTPAGTKTYADAFYACEDQGVPFIHGIDQIFAAFHDVAK